jgi:hypothetical protein
VPEPGAARAQLPTTTLVGMSPPTMAGPTTTTTTTTPDSVDRDATTHTQQPELPRDAAHGTEPFPASDSTTAPFAIATRPEQERELLAGPSTLAEVREVPARSGRSLVPFALLASCATLVAVLALVSVRAVVRSDERPAQSASSLTPAPSRPPALLPASAEKPAEASAHATPSAPPTESSPPASSEPPRPKVASDAPKAGGAAASIRAADRPGPGF